jgi:hypothetical protein
MDLLLAPLNAWLDRYAVILMSAAMLLAGVLGVSYAAWSMRNNYIYFYFKYRFDEYNRVDRDTDPFWYWFAVITYGILGFGSVVMGLFGLLHVYHG